MFIFLLWMTVPRWHRAVADQIAHKDLDFMSFIGLRNWVWERPMSNGFQWGIKSGYDCFIEIDADFRIIPNTFPYARPLKDS